jgi:hypothetical protein
MNEISKMSPDQVLAWEAETGFKSARSLERKLFAVYEKIETLDDFTNFKAKYSNLLQFSKEENDNSFELVGGSSFYDPITSEDGLFQVGKIRYEKTKEGLKLYLVEGNKKSLIPMNFVYGKQSGLKSITVTDPLNETPRSVASSGYYTNSANNRRFNCYLEIYPKNQVASTSVGGWYTYDVEFLYTARFKPQKKILGGWYGYDANISVKDPKFALETESYNAQNLSTITSESSSNIYLILENMYWGQIDQMTYTSSMTITIPSFAFEATMWSSGVPNQNTYSYEGCPFRSTTDTNFYPLSFIYQL